MRQLLSLIPVSQHLDHSGVVAVWVTNKPVVLDFLTSPGGQFAAWGLEVAAEWTWCKLTTHGEPIYPVDSSWRKPWEKLLIAKRVGAPVPSGLASKMIFSVPDLHSRKPNLRGLFLGILGPSFSGLEVFARHLTAGWWSWGDEVLRFQESRQWTSERSRQIE
jgi:N6-adenosine-specific RNA methylase IME4